LFLSISSLPTSTKKPVASFPTDLVSFFVQIDAAILPPPCLNEQRNRCGSTLPEEGN